MESELRCLFPPRLCGLLLVASRMLLIFHSFETPLRHRKNKKARVACEKTLNGGKTGGLVLLRAQKMRRERVSDYLLRKNPHHSPDL